jgi:hypothetical protein
MCFTNLSLQQAIKNSQFVVSLLCACFLWKVFSFTENFTKILQNQNIDLTETCKYEDIVKTTEDIQNDKEF